MLVLCNTFGPIDFSEDQIIREMINFDEGTVDSDVLALLSVITGDYQSKRLREPLRINIP